MPGRFRRVGIIIAHKGRLQTTTDAGIVISVRQLTPPPPSHPDRPGGRAARLLSDESINVYMPLFSCARG